MSERVVGGFAGVYKVLSAFEDTGRCRRGYFIEGLGAAQFGSAGAIDRLRTFTEPDAQSKPVVVALAATDPANAFGAALPWPEPSGDHRAHRPPARDARRGRWSSWSTARSPSTSSAAAARCSPGATTTTCSPRRSPRSPTPARRGALGRLTVEKADGMALLGSGGDTPLRHALTAAGFVATPKGLRLRA